MQYWITGIIVVSVVFSAIVGKFLAHGMGSET